MEAVTDTSGALVHTVQIVHTDGSGEHHIFSTQGRAEAFASAQPWPCLIADYVIDVPERMTEVQQ